MNRYIRLFFHSGALSPVQLWERFFDDEVIDFIVDHTNEFAAQSNAVGFGGATRDSVKTFLGICYTTGFNTLPNIRSYWSSQPILANPSIKAAMSRDTFWNLKKYFHVCDNLNLDAGDKFAKVTPFNDLLNKRFMQFGIFSHHLSIDEQMIAYYGRHSCKMFIKGKPIRFGYKYWCLTSADGYLYQFIPYAGASANNDPTYGLGENVVMKLLSNLEAPAKHNVTFDNFFTSHKLMVGLSNAGYFATGTVRDNRTNHATVMPVKEMKKKARGTFDFRFDQNNSILAVRWNDNSVMFE